MWVTVYDLSKEKEEIRITQEASLHGLGYGLQQNPALFGSKKWWDLVDTDFLPLYIMQGKINDVYLAGHNDFPEFEIDDGKTKTHWQIYGDQSYYKKQRLVRLEYVEMEFKENTDWFVDLDEKCECVIKLQIDIL